MVGYGFRLTHPTKSIFCVSLSRQQTGRLPMAKQKTASRAAAKTAVKKKWAGHKTSAKSTARKTVKSKARGLSAVKPKAAKAVNKAVKSKARPKQRIAISHHREEDFKADGLRT